MVRDWINAGEGSRSSSCLGKRNDEMNCRWSLPEAPRPFSGLVAVEQPKGRLNCLYACMLQCCRVFVPTRLYKKIGPPLRVLGNKWISQSNHRFCNSYGNCATFRNVGQWSLCWSPVYCAISVSRFGWFIRKTTLTDVNVSTDLLICNQFFVTMTWTCWQIGNGESFSGFSAYYEYASCYGVSSDKSVFLLQCS